MFWHLLLVVLDKGSGVRYWLITSICCGFVVQAVWQKARNKSTTNRSNGICYLWMVCDVVYCRRVLTRRGLKVLSRDSSLMTLCTQTPAKHSTSSNTGSNTRRPTSTFRRSTKLRCSLGQQLDYTRRCHVTFLLSFVFTSYELDWTDLN